MLRINIDSALMAHNGSLFLLLGGGGKTEPIPIPNSQYTLTPILSKTASDPELAKIYRNNLVAVTTIDQYRDDKLYVGAFKASEEMFKLSVGGGGISKAWTIPTQVEFDITTNTVSYLDDPIGLISINGLSYWSRARSSWDIKNNGPQNSTVTHPSLKKKRISDNALIKEFTLSSLPEEIVSMIDQGKVYIDNNEYFYGTIPGSNPADRSIYIRAHVNSNRIDILNKVDLMQKLRTLKPTLFGDQAFADEKIRVGDIGFEELKFADPKRIIFTVDFNKYYKNPSGVNAGYMRYSIMLSTEYLNGNSSIPNFAEWKEDERYRNREGYDYEYATEDRLEDSMSLVGYLQTDQEKYGLFLTQFMSDGVPRLLVLKDSRFDNVPENKTEIFKSFWDSKGNGMKSLLDDGEYVFVLWDVGPNHTIVYEHPTAAHQPKIAVYRDKFYFLPKYSFNSTIQAKMAADILFTTRVKRWHRELPLINKKPLDIQEAHEMIFRKDGTCQFILNDENIASVGLEFAPKTEIINNGHNTSPRAPFITTIVDNKYYVFDNRTQKLVIFKIDLIK